MMIRTRNPYFRLVDDLLNDARPWFAGGPSEARGFDLALDVEENGMPTSSAPTCPASTRRPSASTSMKTS